MRRFMRIPLTILCILLGFFSSLRAASDTFVDYQNYNHGYCPDCNCYPCRCGSPDIPGPVPPIPVPAAPCAPPCAKPDPCTPAPVCATQCGISLWIVGGVIAVVAAGAAIIIGLNNGRTDPSLDL